MTTLVGEKFVVGMIGTLCDALESEYGMLIPRLYRIFKPQKGPTLGRCDIAYMFTLAAAIQRFSGNSTLCPTFPPAKKK